MDMLTVLLVDDEPDIRAIGELSLATFAGWQIIPAGSGEEALLRLAETKPDLVLLDVMMPGLDGPGTLARMRATENGRSVPIIFMTARTQRSEVQEYLSLGAIGVIAKPFEPLSLADDIRKIMAAS